MARSTPATLALQKAGVPFDLHEYEYGPNAERIGMQAAEALGIEPARLLKTLMAKAGDETVCVLAPSDRDVNLKKLASAAGAKSAAMMAAAEAERITGYHVGGISPFGQKKRVRVFVEQSALAFPKIVAEVLAHFGGLAVIVQDVVDHLKRRAERATVGGAGLLGRLVDAGQNGAQASARLEEFGGFRADHAQIPRLVE